MTVDGFAGKYVTHKVIDAHIMVQDCVHYSEQSKINGIVNAKNWIKKEMVILQNNN